MLSLKGDRKGKRMQSRNKGRAGRTRKSEGWRESSTHPGPASSRKGRSHICVGLMGSVAGSRSGLGGGAGLERSLHYFQPEPSPLPAPPLLLRATPPQTLSRSRLEAGQRGQGPLGLGRRGKLRGRAWLPEGPGAGFPGRRPARVGEPARVEGTGAGLAAQERWGLGSWGEGRRGEGSGGHLC